MLPLPKHLTITTRQSPLALWQAEHVAALLRTRYPALQVGLLPLTTQGDRRLDVTLTAIGGKGLFIKELEQALCEGHADLAVHSLKDVPMELPEGFVLAAIPLREDPRDAWISSYPTPADLPAGAVVGTASLRRAAQLRARFPQLDIRPVRGNLQTRLAKLDAGEYHGLLLAAAGLHRLGMRTRIQSYLTPEDSLPAPGQGALALEIRADRADLKALLAPLNDAATADRVRAERALSRRLGGACQLPLGAYAEVVEDQFLRLRGLVAAADGHPLIQAEANGSRHAPEALGHLVADLLLAEGAGPLIAQALSNIG